MSDIALEDAIEEAGIESLRNMVREAQWQRDEQFKGQHSDVQSAVEQFSMLVLSALGLEAHGEHASTVIERLIAGDGGETVLRSMLKVVLSQRNTLVTDPATQAELDQRVLRAF